jgi:peptidoglycan/xylan/chitin deacetylase (PgdA/CDA1 family)
VSDSAPADRGVLAMRFDVDSIRCVEEGIPRLRRLADSAGVRFTFFVNMGRSFNWAYNIRHLLRRRTASAPPGEGRGGGSSSRGTPPPTDPEAPLSLPTTQKLGWSAVARTVALNPRLGERYRTTFDALHAEGHELGLHGGTDHVVWQRALDELDGAALEQLYRPASDAFRSRYGRPEAFASPGFRFNEAVLDLLDREGYTYASDMDGAEPFLPPGRTTWQVPVNVMGEGRVPMIEQGLARGTPEPRLVDAIVEEIEARPFALLYGHPYVEGVRADLLERVLERVRDRYDVVPVREYLERWRASDGA